MSVKLELSELRKTRWDTSNHARSVRSGAGCARRRAGNDRARCVRVDSLETAAEGTQPSPCWQRWECGSSFRFPSGTYIKNICSRGLQPAFGIRRMLLFGLSLNAG
jgi:hypothetical protein